MTVRILRGDAPAVAQVTHLYAPPALGQVAIGILGAGKPPLMFAAWNPAAVVAAWNACAYPEFMEATASVAPNGTDVLLTSDVAGRPFYVYATVGGEAFGNCVQIITPVGNVTGGTATITFMGQTTGTFNPVTETAAGLLTLMEALAGSVIQAGDLTITGPTGGPWTFTFGGRYLDQPVPLMTINNANLTGGQAAQDEIQSLSLAVQEPTEFQLERTDTGQTTGVLSTILTASQLQTALAGIGYTTSCTGGPLEPAGGTTEYDTRTRIGSFDASTLTDDTGNATSEGGYFGNSVNESDASTDSGMIECNASGPNFILDYNSNGQGPVVEALNGPGTYLGQIRGLAQFQSHVPQGTVVSSAQLVLDQVNSANAVTINVHGVKQANATWPSTPSAAWDLPLTTAQSTFVSSLQVQVIDVTAIINEILSQGSWAPGNYVMFYLSAASTTGINGFIGNPSDPNPPTLLINYATSPDLHTQMVMVTCDAPHATTIDNAIIPLAIASGTGNIPGYVCKAVKVANASWPANAAAAAANTLTTASTTFEMYTDGTPIEVNVTSVLQEIVNQSSWTPGNSILFYFTPPPTTNNFEMDTDFNFEGYTAPLLEASYGGGLPIDITWIGPNADEYIPPLEVIAVGSFVPPVISVIQIGQPALSAALDVTLEFPGGETLIIRDDVRSQGPNHYDDPYNWEGGDGTFLVPQEGDELYIESGSDNLSYGLRQRQNFIALLGINCLFMTGVHHWWVGQAVEVQTTGTLPGGLAVSTTYYVASINGPYVQLSATPGGRPVTLSSGATGVQTMGVRLSSAEVEARWSGELGLSRLNTQNSTYYEYRERYLSVWCPSVKVGTGAGSGSSRVYFDLGVVPSTVTGIATAGEADQGVNSMLILCESNETEITVLGADLGVAIFPEESGQFDQAQLYSGSLTLGPNVNGNKVTRTTGTFSSLGATIAQNIIL